MTGTLSGWSLTPLRAPPTADTIHWRVGSLRRARLGHQQRLQPLRQQLAVFGSQPGSSYNDFMYYPGEQYPSNGVVTGAQPGASLTMTTTEISATAVTGATYTATIEYANVSWSNCAANPSANVISTFWPMASSSARHPFRAGSRCAWTTVTAGWVCPAAYAGEAIQLQVVATNFLEGPIPSGRCLLCLRRRHSDHHTPYRSGRSQRSDGHRRLSPARST